MIEHEGSTQQIGAVARAGVQLLARSLDPRRVRNPGTARQHRLRAWWSASWPVWDAREPSFAASLDRQRRIFQSESSADLRSLLSDKLATYAHCSEVGIGVPQVLATWMAIDEIAFDGLPDTVCVKPVREGGGLGVLLLERDQKSPRTYFDQHGSAWSAERVRHHYESLALKPAPGRPLILAEQVLRPMKSQHLDDWKVYAFRGTIGLVLQVRRGSARPRLKFYDAQMQPLGRIRTPELCDMSLSTPTHVNALLGAAAVASSSIPLPFVRVDLYETDEGVKLGELSPAPGRTQLFPPELDHHLGSLWEESEAELGFFLRHRPLGQ